MPTAPSTFTSSTPLRQFTNPTGCRHLRVTFYSGCACISQGRSSLMGNTKCRRLSKHIESDEAQTSHYIRLGHGRGMGGRHVSLHLFLATPRDQPFQKSDRRSRIREWPCSDQYALYRAASTLYRPSSHTAAAWKFEPDERWREPRHVAYGRLAGSQ